MMQLNRKSLSRIRFLHFKFVHFLEHVMVDSNALSIILLSAGLMSLVVTVMGIKLRWFRHRLTFEQPADDPVLLKTTSVTEIRENCARGVYRQSVDPESQTYQDIPSKVVINGKTKTKSNSKCLQVLPIKLLSQLQILQDSVYVYAQIIVVTTKL